MVVVLDDEVEDDVDDDVDVEVEVDEEVEELVELEDVEVEVDELVDELVLVHVKSLFPKRNSDILAVFGDYDSRASSLRPAVQGKVILNRENPKFAATDSRAVLDSRSVIKG